MACLAAALVMLASGIATAQSDGPHKTGAEQRPELKRLPKPVEARDPKTAGIAMLGEQIRVGDTVFYLGLFRLGAQPGLWLFRDMDGLAVTDGDIALGPFKLVLARQRALREALQSPAYALTTLPGAFARWPDGEVPYSFEGDWFAHEIPPDLREPIENAMGAYEARTPVDFRPKNANDQSWVRFARTWDFAVCPNSSTSEVGRTNGPTTVYIQVTDCEKRAACEAGELEESECEDFNRRDFQIEASALHEIGHALGFKHEHTRPDRDEHIDIDFECVNQNPISAGVALLGNYNIASDDYEAIGPYDFDSTMHYPSNQRVDEDGNVTCITMVKQPQHREEGDDVGLIGPNRELSREDVNALYHMYRRNNQSNEAGDRFGHRLLAHDFDKDGYTDLAVTAMLEAQPQGPGSGSVMLYKGTADGYVFWKRLSPPIAEASQHFGVALAAGDFDLDGVEDLAVGAPGTTVAGKDDAGAVFIFAIKPNLDAELRRTLTAPGGGEAHDRFGQALAVGRFFSVSQYAGEEQRERRRLHLAIGAPRARPPGTDWRPGYVWFWNEATPDAFGWPDVDAAQLPWAGGFGDTLAALETEGFDWMNQPANDQRRSRLLVSARFDDGLDCGQAAVFIMAADPGGGPGIAMTERIGDPDAAPVSPTLCAMARTDPVAEGVAIPVIDRGFGRALAVGDFDDDGNPEAAVGDPEAGYNAGAAGPGFVYVFDQTAPGGGFTLRQRLDQTTIGADEPGDAFGYALQVTDYDGDGLDDLAVSAPGDDIGQASNAGAVFFYRGCRDFAARHLVLGDLREAISGDLTPTVADRLLFCTGLLRPWQSVNQPGDSDEDDDFFGTALAASDVDADGDPDLVVGTTGEAPGGDPHSGYVHFVKSNGGSAADNFDSRAGFSQETQSPHF